MDNGSGESISANTVDLDAEKQGLQSDLTFLDLETEYRSLKEDPVQNFYKPCLRNSHFYRRAVGYFRSTVFVIIGSAIIEFAKRGGKIHLICSPQLANDDVEEIVQGYIRREQTLASDLIDQFNSLLAHPETALGARTLATLIATDTLEIRLAERRDQRGIYHEKLGVFTDSLGNNVSFKGSANETWSGWHENGNFESIEVFCDWRGGLEKERVKRHIAHFDALWRQDDPDIVVSDFPKTAKEYLSKYAVSNWDELLADTASPTLTRREPMSHQQAAIDEWMRQGRRGILEHATGSGKTFTACMALRDHLKRNQPAIILVPSRLLLEQWASEVRMEAPEATLMLAGGGYSRWKGTQRLSSMTAADEDLGPRVTIAMMPTAATDAFRRSLNQGDHLLVIADEVHQIGSPKNSEFFSVVSGPRLGLSATPQRFGDPEGTEKIFSYFGAVVNPVITLMDAVRSGRLVKYEYFPHKLHLTAPEAEEWSKQSREISLAIARQGVDEKGRKVINDRIKQMLINRSRIAKKASNKTGLAIDILRRGFEEGQSWLVYCEDSEQLSEVLSKLDDVGINAVEYHSNMGGDRDATMEWFRLYGGVMVSIRCLDEGVDIPAVSHALILASSQNPRQFIQRRGRVLRKSPGKHLAVIHDAIVVPTKSDDDVDQFGLLRAELIRAVEFAKNSINQSAGAELREIAIDLGIDPEELSGDAGLEEDEDG